MRSIGNGFHSPPPKKFTLLVTLPPPPHKHKFHDRLGHSRSSVHRLTSPLDVQLHSYIWGRTTVNLFLLLSLFPLVTLHLFAKFFLKTKTNHPAQKELLIASRRFFANHINNYFASGMPTLKFNVSFICLGERKLFLNYRFYLREKKRTILLRTIKCQPRKLQCTRLVPSRLYLDHARRRERKKRDHQRVREGRWEGGEVTLLGGVKK